MCQQGEYVQWPIVDSQQNHLHFVATDNSHYYFNYNHIHDKKINDDQKKNSVDTNNDVNNSDKSSNKNSYNSSENNSNNKNS